MPICRFLHLSQSVSVVQGHKAVHGLAVGIPDNAPSHLVGQSLQQTVFQDPGRPQQSGVLRCGILIDFPNGGAGQNVMELVAK